MQPQGRCCNSAAAAVGLTVSTRGYWIGLTQGDLVNMAYMRECGL